MKARLSKDEYFMLIAQAVSQRSTCLDKQVGCVLVDSSGIILATGYNGAPRGMFHCRTCTVYEYRDKSLCPAAHAEQNALLQADPSRVYACYSTLEPCIVCTRMLMNTECRKVIYGKETKQSGKQLWSILNDPDTSWQLATSRPR